MSLSKLRLLAIAALVCLAAAARAGDVWLGITMSEITPSMARALGLDEGQGVLVDEVVPDSPAAAAGLQTGDVIIAVDGREISGGKGLARGIHRFDPGDEVEIEVLRAGKKRQLGVTLGERERKQTMVWSFGGKEGDAPAILRWNEQEHLRDVMVDAFGKTDRGFLGIVPRADGDEDGVVVGSVTEDGPAGAAGLQRGDRIVALDGEAIASGAELHEFLEDTEPGQTVTVTFVREDVRQEVAVELAETPGRVALNEIQRVFLPRDPRDPSQPRLFGFQTGPGADADALAQEREELARLKAELEELKRELQKLREELPRKSER